MKNIMMQATRMPLLRKATAIAASAVLLLSGGTALAYYTPASYASVDINPSIEFQLNVFGQVIGVRGVNDDGKALLTHITTGADLSQNIQAVVQEAANEGYLKPDSENAIVVSIANNNAAQAQQDTEEAKEQAEAAMKAAGTVGEVEVDRVGYDRVQEARKLGTTPGKLNLVQKYIESAGAAGAQVDVNEWLKKPVKDIMKAIKDNRKADKTMQPDTSATPSASASATASATDSASPAVTLSDTDNGTPTTALSPSPSATHGDESDIDEDDNEQGDNGQGDDEQGDNDDKEIHDNSGADHHDADKPEKTQKHIRTSKPAATPDAHSWSGRNGDENDNNDEND